MINLGIFYSPVLVETHFDSSHDSHVGAIQDGHSIIPHDFSLFGLPIPESTHRESGSECADSTLRRYRVFSFVSTSELSSESIIFQFKFPDFTRMHSTVLVLKSIEKV